VAWAWDPAWIWDLIKTGAGIGFGWWLSQRGQRSARRDAIEDRKTALLESAQDKHRGELRIAYAEFIAATSSFLDSAAFYAISVRSQFQAYEELHATAMAYLKSEEHADRYVDEARQEGAKKLAELVDSFRLANTAYAAKRTALLLLEADEEWGKQINQIVVESDAPQRAEDVDPFLSVLNTTRWRLNALTQSLTGRFAPKSATAIVKTS
jgi:hypothetical protein